MKVIIAGSRTINDYNQLLQAIDKAGYQITEVVSGAAQGVDLLGERYAKEHSIPVKQFLPQWKAIGKSAGYFRNMQMAEYAQALILCWDGMSPGSAQMKRIARMLSMPMVEHIVSYDGF